MRTSFINIILSVVFISTLSTAQDYKVRNVPDNQLPKDVVSTLRRDVVDSSAYPWRAIGRVNIGGTSHCTGSLITDNIVLTAAHCLYSKRLQAMVPANMVHFLAGYAHGDYSGHSKVLAYETGAGFNGTTGADTKNMPHDWALLILADPIGKQLGHIKIHQAFNGASTADSQNQRAVLSTSKIAVAGYPKDRSHLLSIEKNCRIVNAFNKGAVLVTSCLSLQGDSGGPILQEDKDNWVIVGLQTAAAQRGRVRASVGVSGLAFIRTFTNLVDAETRQIPVTPEP